MGYLRVKQLKDAAFSIRREALKEDKLVYLAVANKSLPYRHGRSKIVYIGTTMRGANRIAESAAKQARHLLQEHGVSQLDFFIVSCTGRQRLKSWKKLERALLLVFRERMGEVPRGNKQGRKIKESDEMRFFKREKLVSILEGHAKAKARG